MDIDAMIAVLQAAKAGKQIEHNALGNPTTIGWRTADPPRWDFSGLRYRVKPEPREWWLNIYPSFNSDIVHKTKEAANAGALPDRQELIKVREVLPSP